MWFLRHVEKFKLYFIRPYFKFYPEAQECKQNKCCEVLIVQYEWLHWDKTLTETLIWGIFWQSSIQLLSIKGVMLSLLKYYKTLLEGLRRMWKRSKFSSFNR